VGVGLQAVFTSSFFAHRLKEKIGNTRFPTPTQKGGASSLEVEEHTTHAKPQTTSARFGFLLYIVFASSTL
jgi:hypothetical protein